MDFIKKHWEKFAFGTSLILLGLAGYHIYQNVKLRANDEHITEAVDSVQETLEREPKTKGAEPAYASALKKQWSPYEQSVKQKGFVVYMPPMVRPVVDIEPDVTCEFPGISNLSATGGVGQVDLNWEFGNVPESENVNAIAPGEVVIQRRGMEQSQWTDVSSFSGTNENQYKDTGVKSRARYQYRILVKKGNKTCDEGVIQPEEKTSNTVSVEVESDVRIDLKSISDTDVQIVIKKYAGEDNWNTDSDWFSEGENIQTDNFKTPFTLKNLKRNASYSYLTLTENPIWRQVDGEQKQLSIGVIDRTIRKRHRITYQDNDGKTFTKWQNWEEPSNYYASSNPPPWEAKRDQFDGFWSNVDNLPWGEIPSNLRVNPNKGNEKEEASEEGGSDGNTEASDTEQSSDEASDGGNQDQ